MARISACCFIAVATIALSGCSTADRPVPVQSGATGPTAATKPIDPILGRWGLAAYLRDVDRARTEKEARAQCSNAYVIAKGPTGGAIMHLADEKEPVEVFLKVGAGGKTYLGPAGEAPLAEDREIVSIGPKEMVMRFVDPDVAARYGTSIYLRCGG